MKEWIEEVWRALAATQPLVHCITNYVTVNDVANILLSCGASPIMADDEQEVTEITGLCAALVLNIGTLNSRTIQSMILAGRRANTLGLPVVLDPVGAGASALRTSTALALLEEVRFTAIRGNVSEIKALACGKGGTRGVDANVGDAVTDANLAETTAFAQRLAKETGAVIAITGAIDLVADRSTAYAIRNGHPAMSKITGTGCMLTGVVAACCAAYPQCPLDATAAAVCAMGICGERASREAGEKGTGSLRVGILDAMSQLTAEALIGGAKIETL